MAVSETTDRTIRGSVEALIFDMDGVLIDSEPVHLLAYQELLARFGISYKEADNQELLGRTEQDCAQILVARYGLDIAPAELAFERVRIFQRLLKERPEKRPGVDAILSSAESLELPMAVASSATLETIELVVDTLFIRHYFRSLTSGEEVERGKPAPDVFLLAAQRLSVNPQNCLVVEDSLNGVKAAKAAGMQCVAIPCDATRHQDHSQADLILASLNDIDLRQWCLAQL